jgi:hypothetical protein
MDIASEEQAAQGGGDAQRTGERESRIVVNGAETPAFILHTEVFG